MFAPNFILIFLDWHRIFRVRRLRAGGRSQRLHENSTLSQVDCRYYTKNLTLSHIHVDPTFDLVHLEVLNCKLSLKNYKFYEYGS